MGESSSVALLRGLQVEGLAATPLQPCQLASGKAHASHRPNQDARTASPPPPPMGSAEKIRP